MNEWINDFGFTSIPLLNSWKQQQKNEMKKIRTCSRNFDQWSIKLWMEVLACKAGIDKLWPTDQIQLAFYFFFLIKFHWNIATPVVSYIICRCFSLHGRLSSDDRNDMACKALNIYYLASYRGSLLTPDLKHRWGTI